MAPFYHRQLSSRRNITIIISIVWAIFAISGVTSLIMDISFTFSDSRYHLNQTHAIIRQVLFVAAMVGITMMTMIFTLILYTVAFIKVERRNKIAMLAADRTYHQADQQSSADHYLKIMKQKIVMLGLLLLCSFPYLIAYLVHADMYHASYKLVISLTAYISFSYPGFNAILVAYYTNDVRAEIKILINKYFKL